MDDESTLPERSTRSKVCGWTRGIIGTLIAIGIIIVFYFITTTIIDGSSSLDFLLTEEQDPKSNIKYKVLPEQNHTKTQLPDDLLKYHVLSTINKTNHKSGTLETNPEGRSYIAYIPVPLDEDEEDEEDSEDHLEEERKIKERKNHRRRLSSNENNNNKPLLVPVMIMNHRNNPPSNHYMNKELRNRSGRIPTRLNSHSNTASYPRRPVSKVRRPVSSRGNSRIDFQEPNPRDLRKRMSTRRISHTPLSRRYNRMSSRGDHQRNSGHNFRKDLLPYSPVSSKKNYRYVPNRELRNYRRTNVRTSNDPYYERKTRLVPRVQYEKPFTEVRKSFREGRPRIIEIHRPPDNFRYPSSAGSIQDIIEYLDDDEEREIRPKTRPGRPSYPQRPKFHYESSGIDEDNKSSFYPDDNYFLSTEDYSADDGRFVTNGASKRFPSNVYFNLDDKNNPSDTFTIDDDGHQVFHHNQEIQSYTTRPKTNNDYSSIDHVLPAVKNEPRDPYVPTRSSTSYERPRTRNYNPGSKNEQGPMKIIIDVYPSEDSTHPTDPLRTLMFLSEKLLNYNSKKSPFDETLLTSRNDEDDEIILHLNLFSTPKRSSHSHSRTSYDRQGVSVDIPLTGKLTSMDIYQKIVSKARNNPVASAQTRNAGDHRPVNKDNFEIELFDVEEGHKMFKAIEKGLRDINPHLPQSKRIVFANDEITGEDLYHLGQKSQHQNRPQEELTTILSPSSVKTFSSIQGREEFTTDSVEHLPTPC